MEIDEVTHYWKKASESDFGVAEDLFKSKRYSYALFFCHLSLEKLLKGFIVEHTKKSAPLQHNLVRLAELAGFGLTDKEIDLLSEITTFNIKSRYDDYKTNFYKKATSAYTKKYMQSTKELLAWLKKNYQKK